MELSLWESLVASYSKSVHQNGDARVEDWPLVYNPWTVVGIVVAYVLMCILGPKWMASRKPYELKLVLVIYNGAMVFFSYYIAKELLICALELKYNFICDLVEYKSEPVYIRLAAAVWLYYISKFVEMLDTVFFILRKKESQITFLHVYHHSTMFFIWWIAIKWFAGGMAFFSPMLNCSVHVLMYTYYGLSLFPSLRKYLWWKKYVTLIQLGQFVFVIFLTLYNLFTGCEYDRRVQWALAIYVTTQFGLFMNFYSKSYGKKRSKTNAGNLSGTHSGEADGSHSSISSNGFRHYEEDAFHGKNDEVRKR